LQPLIFGPTKDRIINILTVLRPGSAGTLNVTIFNIEVFQ